MTTKTELLKLVESRFSVTEESVQFGELEYQLFRVTDPDVLLDDAAITTTHEQTDYAPYWAQAWEAAYGLAEFIASMDIHGKSILDLGCGLGITGAVASRLGGIVTLADYAPPALDFAKLNCHESRERCKFLKLDWRTDDLSTKFDIIVGADILYDRCDLPFLDAFWRAHLKPTGSLLLSDPTRAMSAEFFAWLRERGWEFKESTMSIVQSDRPIRIMKTQLPK